MNRIVHFEMHSSDPQQSNAFFQDVFGWKMSKWEGPTEYWLVETGAEGTPGINGGLLRSQDNQPRTVNTLQVASVDEAMQKVRDHGGNVVVDKMAITGVGYLAYCTDPTGVLFGIMHEDPAAQ